MKLITAPLGFCRKVFLYRVPISIAEHCDGFLRKPTKVAPVADWLGSVRTGINVGFWFGLCVSFAVFAMCFDMIHHIPWWLKMSLVVCPFLGAYLGFLATIITGPSTAYGDTQVGIENED